MEHGPIFIIGMPRSGTKLLRDILNNHTLISIPDAETGFIPFFYKKFEEYGNLKDSINFDKFYKDFKNTTFFTYITDSEIIWERSSWFNSIQISTLNEVLKKLYSMHANFYGKEIWGDKTPTYLKEIMLIKKIFPNAIFIHIIRDVRDYCLSIKKAWNKNIYKAASDWVNCINSCKIDAIKLDVDSYYEVKYEELIKIPFLTIKKLCEFLEIKFEKDMITLRRPSENLGDTKGVTRIVSHNYEKWKNELTISQINKIEKIAYNLMIDLDYKPFTKGERKGVLNIELFIYRLFDYANLLKFRFKEKQNLIDSIKWIYRHHKYMK